MQHRVLRLLSTARKIDADISSAVEGGLAALVIGNCLQRLRGKEGDGTADPILETACQLSAAARQPDTILPLLESVAFRLWQATEPPSETCSFSVESEELTRQRAKVLFLESWHVGTGKQACLT